MTPEHDDGNGKVAKAEVAGLEKRFEDCRSVCEHWRFKMEERISTVEKFQNRAIGVLLVVQFIGFGGLAALIVMMVRATSR